MTNEDIVHVDSNVLLELEREAKRLALIKQQEALLRRAKLQEQEAQRQVATCETPLCKWENDDGSIEWLTNDEWLARHKVIHKKQCDLKFLKQSNIAKLFWNMDLCDYKASTPSQKKALLAVQKMIDSKSGKVVLLGKCGVGKTMLASIAAHKLHGDIFSMLEVASTIKDSFSVKGTSELSVLKRFSTLPFLAIDEVEKSYNTQSERNWLSYIIDKRHCNKLPTMILGNATVAEFSALMTQDILSRLSDKDSIRVVIEGADKRKA